MVLKKFPLQKVQFQEDSQQRNLLKHTLRLPTVWFVAFFLLLCVGIEMSLGRWGYSFLVEARHGDPLLMGWVISGLGLGLMLSRFVFANIAQHMSGKILLQLCLIGVLLGIAWVWLSPQSSMAGLGFCLIGFSLGPIFPTTVSLLPRAVAQSLLPQAIGFIAGIANISSGLFPWAGGTVIQFFGFQSLLAYAFFLLVTAQILYIFLQGRFHMYP
jgi:fucose permease